MRRLRPAEKAVELAVSLEALLAEDGGENTHKLDYNVDRVWKQRRAVFGIAEPSAPFTRCVAAFHQVRSASTVKVRGRGKVKSDDIVADGVAVCKSVIHAVIRRRALPKWYEFELGIDRGT
jgi:hypothetical protein